MLIRIIKSCNLDHQILSEISYLLRDSFKERLDNGINFKCGLFTSDDIRNYLNNNSYVVLVYDNNIIIGTASIIIRKKWIYKYASFDNLAVHRNYQNKGIASLIFSKVKNMARRQDLDFLTSSTAINALSSVQFHKKNNFIIYKTTHGLDYDSYNYIFPIKKLNLLKIKFIKNTIFLIYSVYQYFKN